MDKLLHSIFLKSPANLWDAFEEECQKFYNEPAHTLTEMRTRDNKKVRGDIFEDFCVLYLIKIKKYDNVWRLSDVPIDVLERLTMKRQDFGIDIIAEKDGIYSAIQCKYKKQTTRSNCITWKALSTFYALCLRCGPFDKYIVMTNANTVRHMGKRTPKDVSICLKTLQGMTSEEWTSMCNLEEHKLSDTVPLKSSEEVRQARLKFFETKVLNAAE
jgi:predicted helicase